jgi:hypothetical protein
MFASRYFVIRLLKQKNLTPAPKPSLETQRRREENGLFLFSAEIGGKQEKAMRKG